MIVTIGNYQVAVSKVVEPDQGKRLKRIWQQTKIRRELALEQRKIQRVVPGAWLR